MHSSKHFNNPTHSTGDQSLYFGRLVSLVGEEHHLTELQMTTLLSATPTQLLVNTGGHFSSALAQHASIVRCRYGPSGAGHHGMASSGNPYFHYRKLVPIAVLMLEHISR